MNRLVIKPAAIIDGTGVQPRRGQAIVVEDDRIQWIGRVADLSSDLAAARVMEAPNAMLLPGLIDCHVHLMCPAERCEPATYIAAADDQLLVRAVAKAQAGLRAGVTTMRDLGSRNFLLVPLRDAIAAGQLLGPRLVLAGPALTRTGGHFHYLGWEADSVEDLTAAARRVCEGGADLVKVMATGGRTTPGSDPELPQYSAEHLHAAVEQAHALGRKLTAHVHGVEGIRNAVAAGVDCLEHCSWMGPGDRTAYAPELGSRIVDQGMYVSPTFGARARTTAEHVFPELSPAEHRQLNEVQESRFEAVRQMIALDAKIVASSDAGMPGTHTQDFAHTVVVLAKRIGMPPLKAIRAATSLAAEALGVAQQTGSIAVGKHADLLLVDGAPSSDIEALLRVRCVVRDGQIVAGDA